MRGPHTAAPATRRGAPHLRPARRRAPPLRSAGRTQGARTHSMPLGTPLGVPAVARGSESRRRRTGARPKRSQRSARGAAGARATDMEVGREGLEVRKLLWAAQVAGADDRLNLFGHQQLLELVGDPCHPVRDVQVADQQHQHPSSMTSHVTSSFEKEKNLNFFELFKGPPQSASS